MKLRCDRAFGHAIILGLKVQVREMDLTTQRLRDYELVMVLSPEVGDEEVTAAVERVTGFVTEHGGSVVDEENWGLRRLAYPIRNFQEGNYLLTRFTLDSQDVKELDRTLTASEEGLRHLVMLAPKAQVKA